MKCWLSMTLKSHLKIGVGDRAKRPSDVAGAMNAVSSSPKDAGPPSAGFGPGGGFVVCVNLLVSQV